MESKENIVYLNGKYIPRKNAKISVLDQGFLRGDGLFETILIRKGKIPLLEGHLDRMYQSASLIKLKIPIARDELIQVLLKLPQKNNIENGRLRLVITRGVGDSMDPIEDPTGKKPSNLIPTLLVLAEPLPPHLSPKIYESGVPVVTTPVAIFNNLFPLHVKSISYFHNMAAKRAARAQGAFEAILTDANGICREGSTSNLFWIRKNKVFSPPLDVGALPGVTRKHLVEILKTMNNPLHEEIITKEQLTQMDEVFITSSGIGVLPVNKVNGKTITDGIGPLTRKIREHFDRYLDNLE
jgi:branched-chain amino acid aminotransferase